MVRKTVNSEKIEQLSKTINQKVYMLDKGRQEFEIQIDQINQNFYMKLKDRFPDLTKADQRLCTLMVLDFSTKDIASLLNIAPESVRVSRYRLKKKLKLASEDDLRDFLKNRL